MQLYDITIAANTTRQLDAPGSYFYYYAGSAGGADSTITLRGLSSGLRLILKPGQAFRLPNGQKETAWVMTNYANTATIIGTVLVGDGDITDNRVTGSVEVVDGGKNRTLSGSAFQAVLTLAALAGNYSHVSLYNTSTTKNLIVKSYRVTADAAAYVFSDFRNAALSTISTFQPINKKTGGASSIGQSKTQTAAAPLNVNRLDQVAVSATSMTNVILQEPMIISPGYEMIFVPVTVNSGITVAMEFIEESAT